MARSKPKLVVHRYTTGDPSLRRSHRLRLREPFRLDALPPELRSMIYGFALYDESQVDGMDDYTEYPRLGARPSDDALALSHVSREFCEGGLDGGVLC